MLTRETIRDLAGFQYSEPCAVSFYYQPQTPQNKSHREEGILVKDLVRAKLQEIEQHGRNGGTRADLRRILEVAESLHGNGGRAKAIFACAQQNFWREFDLPPRLPGTRLFVNQRFHLKPLAALGESLLRTCVVALDRTRARFFELWLDEISERKPMLNELPRSGRSEGWAGFEAGHAERHLDQEALHFFKRVGERLRELYESGFEKFIVGCRDENWPEIEPHFHAYVRQRVLARFVVDPAVATADQVRKESERLLAEYSQNRRQALIREVLGETRRNGRGALGLNRVLLALETGEMQTLLLSENFAAPGARCTNCGHLDARMVPNCAVCGQPTVEVEDLADVLLSEAIRNGIEVVYVTSEPELSRYDGIGALLRFRADQNTEAKKAG